MKRNAFLEVTDEWERQPITYQEFSGRQYPNLDEFEIDGMQKDVCGFNEQVIIRTLNDISIKIQKYKISQQTTTGAVIRVDGGLTGNEDDDWLRSNRQHRTTIKIQDKWSVPNIRKLRQAIARCELYQNGRARIEIQIVKDILRYVDLPFPLDKNGCIGCFN